MPIQIVKMNTSILEYFRMMMDFDNESDEYKKVTEAEFIEKLTEALNEGTAVKVIKWV